MSFYDNFGGRREDITLWLLYQRWLSKYLILSNCFNVKLTGFKVQYSMYASAHTKDG